MGEPNRSFRVMYKEESLIPEIPFQCLAPRIQLAVAATPAAIRELHDFKKLRSKSSNEFENSEDYFRDFQRFCSVFLLKKELYIRRQISPASQKIKDSPQNFLSSFRAFEAEDVTAFLTRRLKILKREDLVLFGKINPIILQESVPSKDLEVLEEVFRLECARHLENLEWQFPQIPWREADAEKHLANIRLHGDEGFYDSEDPKISQAITKFHSKKKLLLHVCCGPDAGGVIEQLKDNFELTCFWYDPNIQPRAEHDKRLETFFKSL